jgi:hypothetical protein
MAFQPAPVLEGEYHVRQRSTGRRIAFGGMVAAALLAGGYATGNAETLQAPESSGVMATLVGVVSVQDLAVSEANRQALQAQQNATAVELPAHLLPNGGLTSQPSQATLDALPSVAPNTDVWGAAPSFSSIKGFVGIFGGQNETINGEGFEPPDQGLAVNNNVAVEHNNLLIQFYNATTGAPLLSKPLADSAFFNTGSDGLTDTQVFYDPNHQPLVSRCGHVEQQF